MDFEVRVADDLKGMLFPTDQVQRHPKNVRKGKPQIIALSLRRFGQQKPIVVQKATPDGEVRMLIIAGNHLHEAAADILKWPQMAMSFVIMSDDEAYQYLLADNRASDLAEYDRQALAASLGELAERGILADSLWSADDLDDLLADIKPLESIYQEFTGDYSDDPETRKERQHRELTRVATKMREVPVVITAEQHVVFMQQIAKLQKAWHTGGAIETILLAVARCAEGLEDPAQDAPQSPPEPAPDTGTAAAPIAAVEPDLGGLAQPEPVPVPAPSGEPDYWRNTVLKFMKAVDATRLDRVKKSVLFAVLEGIAPPMAVGPVSTMEPRRAVLALRESIILTFDGDVVDVDQLELLAQRVADQRMAIRPEVRGDKEGTTELGGEGTRA